MKATESALLLGAGAAIGVFVAWTAQGVVVEPGPRTPPAAVTAAASPSAPPSAPRVVDAGSAASLDDRAAERAARAAVEKERDTLRAELAALRSATAAQAAETAWPAHERKPVERLAPDAAARRGATIGGEIEPLLRSKDREKLNAFLRELASLGRAGWPHIERLLTTKPAPGSKDEEDDEDADGEAAFRDSGIQHELLQLVADGSLRDYALDAVLHPESHPREVREALVNGIYVVAATPDEQAQLRRALSSEKDPEIANALLAALVNVGALDGQGLATFFREASSIESRRAIAAQIVGTRALPPEILRDMARSESDPATQGMLRHAVLQSEPPVQGYLVSGTTAGSQAEKAGLLTGDIIISYNGFEVKSTRQLARLKQEARPDATINVGVWRDGVVSTVLLRPGQIGVSGEVVKPAVRK
ncbi:MAG: PDZ domain-containing protein [Planctomycetota bacterium]